MEELDYSTCSPDNAKNLTEICTYEDSIHNQACFPKDISRTFSNFAGYWCIINAILGFSGNLLTLLAIPYATIKRRYGFTNGWNPTTLFILNLALSDMLYCAVNLPLYSLQYLKRGWILGPELCYANAVFRYINAFSDWMSLAMIAVSRCVCLKKPRLIEATKTKTIVTLVIAAIWFYSILLISPLFPEGSFGTFGYNCRSGKCDFISLGSAKVNGLLFGIAFILPCSFIISSYYVIWRHAKLAAHYLKKSGGKHSQGIRDREFRMTITILFICLSYIVFVMPISLCNVLDPDVNNPNIHLGAFCLYWSQYSLNFVVYAARSEQYRKAYIAFLKMVKETMTIIETQQNEITMSKPSIVIDKNLLPRDLRLNWKQYVNANRGLPAANLPIQRISGLDNDINMVTFKHSHWAGVSSKVRSGEFNSILNNIRISNHEPLSTSNNTKFNSSHLILGDRTASMLRRVSFRGRTSLHTEDFWRVNVDVDDKGQEICLDPTFNMVDPDWIEWNTPSNSNHGFCQSIDDEVFMNPAAIDPEVILSYLELPMRKRRVSV